MVTIYEEATILVFPKIAVYFKLNYFKLIHLQANMLSSFNFPYFAVNYTNLPKNCHILHHQQWGYTNLTNYEFS